MILEDGVWNGFLLGHGRAEIVPCRFCGAADGDGHLFWECTHPPLVHFRENPEFHGLTNVDKSAWPGCLLWHGWLPALACPGGDSPRADSAGDIGFHRLECALRSYSDGVCREWRVSDQFFFLSWLILVSLVTLVFGMLLMIFLVLVLVGAVSLLICLGRVGFRGGGGIWTCFLLMVV